MKIRTIIFWLIILGIGYYLYTHPAIIEDNLPMLENIIEKAKGVFNNDSPQVKEMSTFIKDNDLERLKIEDGDTVFIRFSTDSMVTINQEIYDVALEAYDIFQKPLIVEGYFLEEPFFQLQTTNPNEEDTLFFTDIRTSEFMIENDIMIFDVFVGNVEVKDDEVLVEVEYIGPEEDFFADYAGMCFVIIQDVPWVEDITITYLKKDLCLSMKTTSTNVLELYAEEISMDKFLENLELEQCEPKETSVDENMNEYTDDGDENIAMGGSGLECSTDVKQAYQEYIAAYNKLVYLQGDTEAAEAAYIPYKFYKECYESHPEMEE
ncbi:MAG: hypothetical protein ABIB43_04965 [archaeon]